MSSPDPTAQRPWEERERPLAVTLPAETWRLIFAATSGAGESRHRFAVADLKKALEKAGL